MYAKQAYYEAQLREYETENRPLRREIRNLAKLIKDEEDLFFSTANFPNLIPLEMQLKEVREKNKVLEQLQRTTVGARETNRSVIEEPY